jgi:hypothetical protein
MSERRGLNLRIDAIGCVVVVLLMAALAGMLVASGTPFPHLDSVLYFQVSQHLAEGEGSSFAYYTRLYFARGANDWQFNLHGQLFGFLHALLAADGSSAALLNSAAIWLALTIGIAGAAAWSVFAAWRERPWARVALVGWSALAVGAIGAALVGRPEQLVPLVMVMLVWVENHWAGLRRVWSRAVAIGVLAAISPMSGVLGGLLLTLLGTLNAPRRESWREPLVMALGAGLVWVLVISAVSPHSAWTIFRNTVEQAGAIGSGWVSHRYVAWELTLDPRKPGLILSWLALAAVLLAAWRDPSVNVWRRVAIGALGLVLVALVYMTSIRQTLTYNFIGLAPALWLLLLAPADERQRGDTPKWAVWMMLAVGAPALGWITHAINAAHVQQHQTTFAHAQRAWATMSTPFGRDTPIVVSEVSVPPLSLLASPERPLYSAADLTVEQIARLETTFSITSGGVLTPAADSGPPPGLPGWRPLGRFPANCVGDQCSSGWAFTLWVPPAD